MPKHTLKVLQEPFENAGNQSPKFWVLQKTSFIKITDKADKDD